MDAWRMRCPTCPNKYRCVLGDGPIPNQYMFVGEAPGRDEDAGGRPFIGQAGLEFNENYLRLAGLSRDDIYITNTVKCRPDLNRKPSAKEVAGCSSHFLPEELNSVQPKVIFLMGATACSLIPDIDLEVEHGIPRWGKLFGWEGWIIPQYHPAAGLHDGAMMGPLLEDFERAGRWLGNDGEKMWPIEHTQPPIDKDYRLVRDIHQVAAYFQQSPAEMELIAVDTESHAGVPWSIQFSTRPNTGRMILMQDEDSLWGLRERLQHAVGFGVELVFHNAPADLAIVEGLGIKGFKYHDTMAECYHFGNFLRQGLKVLSYRLLGRGRKSWEETVGPYSREALLNWMMNAIDIAERDMKVVEHKQLKTKVKVIETAGEVEKLLRRVYRHTLAGDDYDPWERLDERDWDWSESIFKPYPRLGIAHCPLDVAVEYGCSDADDTLQLALLFDRMRREFQENLDIQPEDCDVINTPSTKSNGAGRDGVQTHHHPSIWT